MIVQKLSRLSPQDSRKLLSSIVLSILTLYLIYSGFKRQSKNVSSHQSSKDRQPLPSTNYAFSAFLAAPTTETQNDDDDLYFVGTRMMIYQLLHDPTTRTNNSYPFVVLVTADVGTLNPSLAQGVH
jgi:hypothetical protein